jgi:hypothetical protein
MTVQGLFRFSMSRRLLVPGISDKYIVLIVNGLVVFAVIGGLSHFNPGSSTNSQRSWTMTWYVFGMIAGVLPIEDILGGNDVGSFEKYAGWFLGVLVTVGSEQGLDIKQ